VTPWRDRLVEVTEENLKLAWTWIRNLDTNGSTNTLGTDIYTHLNIYHAIYSNILLNCLSSA